MASNPRTTNDNESGGSDLFGHEAGGTDELRPKP